MTACPHPEKHGYGRKARAKLALRRMSGIRRRGDLAVYRCRCGLFHIGHKLGTKASGVRSGFAVELHEERPLGLRPQAVEGRGLVTLEAGIDQLLERNVDPTALFATAADTATASCVVVTRHSRIVVDLYNQHNPVSGVVRAGSARPDAGERSPIREHRRANSGAPKT